ncbi:hypothetical protein APHAL10511_000803 [Amanita phalloides]|nr:hypothetical protein APHAL10511_000803 [Amanita phalloides]
MPSSSGSESDPLNALVVDGQDGHIHQDSINTNDKKDRTPLPWRQLLIVYTIQFAEPITGCIIYPFINQFVRETGITRGDERSTGYFAGLIESTFFISEALTVVFWGMASDRFGRRPILVLGPLGLAVGMIGFGMSTQFWLLVAFRCLQGTFNGNIGVSKTVMGELTDKTNIADAFALMPVMWSIGTTLAPILGGLLSQPAIRWPETLGKITYLKNHPYFLPCFAAAMIAFLTYLGALVGLQETLPSAILRKKQRHLQSSPSPSTNLSVDNDVPNYGSNGATFRQNGPPPDLDDVMAKTERPPTPREILTRDVLSILINYGLLAFCDMSIQVLIPLMWSTSPEHGGLGFTPYMIGTTMGTFGVINAFIQITCLGAVIRYFGPRNVYIFGFSSYLVALSSLLLQVYFSRQVGGADWRVWIAIIVQLSMQSINYATYGNFRIISDRLGTLT